MIKISSIPKFSLDISRGSVETRYKKAAEMTDAFFNEIKDEFVNRSITLQKIQKKIYKVMPEKKWIEVVQNTEPGSKGAMNLGIDEDSKKLGYWLHLPLNNITKKVDAININTITHETSHLFSYLLNPKIPGRGVHIVNKYGIKSIDDFYASHLYNVDEKAFNPSTLKRKINSFLKDKPASEKVDIFQYWRYNLKDEFRAYMTGNKYQKKLQEIKPEIYESFTSNNIAIKPADGREFNLSDKAKLIKEMLADVIKKERRAHAKSLM